MTPPDFDFGPGLRALLHQAVAHEAGATVAPAEVCLRAALDAALSGLRYIAEAEGRDPGLRGVARGALDEAEDLASAV